MLPKALTVSELSQNIKFLLEQSFDQVYLKGEISNIARPRSGHIYFNVKDDRSQIAGVMFRSAVMRTKFELDNGIEVLLCGRITVYEPRGVYQIIVERVEPIGSGALQLAFEQLKEKLSKEGLFDPQCKQEIPYLPQGIGIVTSPSGAALQDILNILSRRYPNIPVLINPVSVQGDLAAAEIAGAIDQFQEIPEIDLLIVGRGGGSIEDLWSFNEEMVARAIFRSRIPVISAVGHETDFTISDFVADLRAPTPSAAAELAVPLKSDLVQRIEETHERLTMLIHNKLDLFMDRFSHIHRRLRPPKWLIQGNMLKTDELTTRLTHVIKNKLVHAQGFWGKLNQYLVFQSPWEQIKTGRIQIQELNQLLKQKIRELLHQKESRLLELSPVLNSLNPVSVMNRGYALLTDADNLIISSVEQVRKDALISAHLNDGVIESRVATVRPRQDQQ